MTSLIQSWRAVLLLGAIIAAGAAQAEDLPGEIGPITGDWSGSHDPGGPGCDPCCAPCVQPCCDRGGFLAGVDLLYLEPRLSRDIAFTVTFDTEEDQTFNRNADFSPRFWLGYSSASGVGVRIRYWSFEDDVEEAYSIAGPFAGPAVRSSALRNAFQAFVGRVVANAELEMQTVDAEATWSDSWRNTLILASAGIRYAEVEHSYRIEEFTAGGFQTGSGILTSDADHHGLGPTLGVELVRSIGRSGLGVYATTRGSFLAFDREVTSSLTNAFVFIPRVGRVSIDSTAHADDEDFITIGELGLGVQYGGELGWGTAVFVRAGYEGQLWTDVGSPTMIDDGNLGLHGAMLTIGLNR